MEDGTLPQTDAPESSVAHDGGEAPERAAIALVRISDWVAFRAEAEALKSELTELRDHFKEYVERAEEAKNRAELDMSAATVAAEDIEKLRAEATSARDAASSSAAEATQARSQSDTALQEVAALKASLEANATAVIQALPGAQESSNQMAGYLGTVRAHAEAAATITNELRTRIPAIDEIRVKQKEYELLLATLKGEFIGLKAKIEGLLPGATSAGLAAAFNQQRKRFQTPMRGWALLFICSLLGLLVLAFVGSENLLSEKGGSPWVAAGLYFVRRLPFYVPLVWLAIYSGRHHMQAKRIEEDYAYKESISTAFEGYKNQMSNDALGNVNPTPLAVLCNNALKMLAEPPGRIYEGKHQDITPTTPIVDLVRELQGLVKEIRGKGPESFGQLAGKAIDMATSGEPSP